MLNKVNKGRARVDFEVNVKEVEKAVKSLSECGQLPGHTTVMV